MLNPSLKHPRLAVFCWVIASFFVVFQFFLQSVTSVLSHYWLTDFHLSALGLSILSSAFFYAYVLMQVPVGILFDNIKAEKLIAAAAAVVGLACMVLANTHVFWLACIARIFMGGACAFGFVGMLRVTAFVFQAQRFGLMIGISETLTMSSVTFGIMLFAWLLTFISWRIDMFVCGIVALVLSAASFLLIYFQKPDVKTPSKHGLSFGFIWRDLKVIVKDRQLWLASVYSFFMIAVINVFTSLWGVDFLVHTQTVNTQTAANVMSMIFVGIAVGCPLLGLITNKYVSSLRAMFICALCATLIMSYLLFSTGISLWILYLGYILVGVFCAAYIPAFALMKEKTVQTRQATSLAFANMLTMSGAPILQPLVAAIIVHQGGLLHISAMGFRLALLILPLGMLIAFVLCFFIRPANLPNA